MNEDEPTQPNTQALAIRPVAALAPRLVNLSLPEIERLAALLVASRMVKDVTSVAQATAKIVYGQELGIGPMASLRGIYFIEGNLSPSAITLAGLIQNSGRYSYRILEWTAQVCRIAFFDRGASLGPPSEFTIAEAGRILQKGQPLTQKDNWKYYPKSMLWARALAQGARAYCPGILGGAPIYTLEEVQNAPPTDALTGEIIVDVDTATYTEIVEPDLLTPTQRDAINRAFTQLGWNAPKRGAWLREGYGVGLNQLMLTDADAVVRLLRAELVTAGLEPSDTDAEETEIEVTATELNERTE